MSGKIKRLITKLNKKWLDIKGVEGIGQSKIDNKDCIIVFISQNTEEIRNNIPDLVEGVPVQFFDSGEIFLEKGD